MRCYAELPSDPLSSLAAVTRTSEIISVVSDILRYIGHAMCSTLPSAGILSGLLLDVDIYHGVTGRVCISA